jgi:hypothetical protein
MGLYVDELLFGWRLLGKMATLVLRGVLRIIENLSHVVLKWRKETHL